LLFVPAGFPFTNQAYDGVEPSLNGVAENVTIVPAQIVVKEAEIETVGTIEEPTVIVIEVEFAVVELTQFAFEVNVQVTTSLFNKELFE
jgi:hypothetical protein